MVSDLGPRVISRMRRSFWPLAVVVALACGLITARAIRGGGFYDDDLATFGLGQEYGFGLNTFIGLPGAREHFNPAATALFKAVGVTGPEWVVAAAITVLLVGLFTILVTTLTRQITDSPAAALTLGFLAGTSIVIGRIALQWTMVSVYLTMLCAGLATLILAIRWLRKRSALTLIGCGAAQLLALWFSDRATLVPLLVLALVWVLGPEKDGWSPIELWRRSQSALPLLATVFGIVFVQILITVVMMSRNTDTPGFAAANTTTITTWGLVVINWWLRGVTSVLANHFPRNVVSEMNLLSIGASPAGGWLLGASVLVGLIVGTVRNLKSALTWLLLIIFVTLSGVQIAAVRLAAFGPERIAEIPRYQEMTVLGFICLVPLAWNAAGRPRPAKPWPTTLAAVLLIGFGSFWFLQLRSGIRSAQAQPNSAAAYAKNLRSSLSHATASGRSVTLLDEYVPDYMLWRTVPQKARYGWLSRVAGVLAPGVRLPPINGPYGQVLRADQAGSIRPVVLGATRRKILAGGSCGQATVGAQWLDPGVFGEVLAVPERMAVSNRPLLLSVDLKPGSGRGHASVVVPGSLPLFSFDLDRFPTGFRYLLPAGTRSVSVELWDGSAACFTSLSVSPILRP